MNNHSTQDFQSRSLKDKAWLQQIVESSPIATFVIDATHTLTHWNRACEIVTGTKAADVVGTRRAWAAFYPRERPVMADLIIDKILDVEVGRVYRDKYHPSSIIANAWEAEDYFSHMPGGGKWLAFSAVALYDDDGRIVAAIEILRDITQEKHLIQALNQSNQVAQHQLIQLNEAVNNIDQGLSVFDAEMRLAVWNRRFIELIDLPDGFVRRGIPIEDIFRFNAERGEYGAGDSEEQVRQRIELVRQGQAHCFERVRPNGQALEVRGRPLPEGGFVTIYTDITARHQAEQNQHEILDELERRVEERTRSLREQERALVQKSGLLEAVVENVSLGISMFDKDLKLLVHNQMFLDLLNFPDSFGAPGTPLAAMFRLNAERGEYGPGDVEQLVEERLEKARHPIEHKFRRKTSTGTIMEVHGKPLPPEIGGFVTVYADVTDLVHAKEQAEKALAELRLAQEQLVLAEKMASLGQLVAGVAHEINTPVGIALSAASHLQKETGTLLSLLGDNRMKRTDLNDYTGVATESTRLLVANLHRAADLIQSFKQVAVDQTSQELRRFNLAEYIDEVLLSLLPTLRKTTHRVVVECPADLELESYPGALAHVLTNLTMNALIHGFEGFDAQQPGTIRIAASLESEQIKLVFADDGLGIPAKHLSQIFDPFFTTKRGEGGSGLGLNVVFNSVTSNLQGSIVCDSAPGCGTAFTMRLPVSVKAASMKGR